MQPFDFPRGAERYLREHNLPHSQRPEDSQFEPERWATLPMSA